MKYVLFFFCLSVVLLMTMINLDSPWRYLILWPCGSSVILTLAYLTNTPTLIAGKTNQGSLSYFMSILTLPWLILTWITWIIQAIFSQEEGVSQVQGTKIYLSRWPVFGPDARSFDRVIDLTAECPRWYQIGQGYECIPCLDGMPLKNFLPMQPIDTQMKVLIHCAQGHGRSATFTSILLQRMGLFATTEEAYHHILISRPLAQVSLEQYNQMRTYNKGTIK